MNEFHLTYIFELKDATNLNLLKIVTHNNIIILVIMTIVIILYVI